MEWARHVTGAVPDLHGFSELQLYLNTFIISCGGKKTSEATGKRNKVLSLTILSKSIEENANCWRIRV